ncbi:MAG TPA: acetyl-CoA carboxylase biotin carboxyl carrier protein [Candidatus Eremiobacteraceae bacterium]|nr:acetyl-CoA carboxylase biotin carboxyl carrier protein [Candidatus Eremiobacteraceae bacterium]
MELDKEVLDELVALMQRDGLDRLRVEMGDFDLDLRMSLPVAAAPAPSAKHAAPPPSVAKSETVAPANVRKVLAPLVGVFYRAPAPGAKPFVEVGDQVSAGQVLCILEAMKLMNEIVSEHSGSVARICAKDGELVTLQQELYWIET